jgi:tRNA (guanine37-N1)-methyltransferase
MRFDVVTLFPEFFTSPLAASLLGKACEKRLLEVGLCNPRDFAEGKHRSTDDAPFGGGSGMVMLPGPLCAAIESCAAPAGDAAPAPLRVFLSPQGRPFDQSAARRFAAHGRVVLVCGRYEGIDERVIDSVIDEEVSIGDFVLSGGEVAALVVIDAVARLLPGVLGNAGSLDEESFATGLLEYPQYTRPQEFRGLRVPEILLSGDHGKIRRWRRARMLERTRRRRPDLFARHVLTDEDRKLIEELDRAAAGPQRLDLDPGDREA